MNSECNDCKLDFRREPGFYLGSIYVNYGVTVVLSATVFFSLTLAAHWSRLPAVLTALACTILFPLWFFRFARSLWLAIDNAVAPVRSPTVESSEIVESDAVESPHQQSFDDVEVANFRSDDMMAGGTMAIVVVIAVLAFIAAMVVVVFWSINARRMS